MTAALKPWSAPRESRPKARRNDWEAIEQKQLFDWLDLQYPKESKLIYHVPNGGKRDAITAKKLQGQGVKAGIPDICIDLARGGYFGMRIEFKPNRAHKSTVSPAQQATLYLLNDAGFYATVCYGFEDARQAITAYLTLPKTEARP